MLSATPLNKSEAMEEKTIEVSVKGKWIKVPAVKVNGAVLTVRGGWLKMATVHDEAWLPTEVSEPEAYVQALREDGAGADIFTFAQRLPGSKPKYDFPMEWDSVAVIHFATFQEWWEKLPQEARKNVRRSQKRGIAIRVQDFDDKLIEGIEGVNNDSSARQGERNYYYGRSRDQLKKDYSAFLDRSDFICAFLGEEMVGFLKVVYRGDVASILNLTTKASHADKRPANALIAKAVELVGAKGISYLTFGMYNYGNKRESPLREFKARNGFEEILTPRFYVPLTPWGSLCLKLKLHRGLLGILPQAAITALLGARLKWRRFQSVAVDKPV
jgi:hypothetical protein